MNLVEGIFNALREGIESLKENPKEAFLIGLMITILYSLEAIPIIGGIIYGYGIVKALEKLTNRKASKLAYISSIALGIIGGTTILLAQLFPKNLLILVVSSLITIIASIILIPQIIFGVFGREKFIFSRMDLMFYVGLILIGIILGIPFTVFVAISTVLFGIILKVPILSLIVIFFLLSPLYYYLFYKAQIEFAKFLLSKSK